MATIYISEAEAVADFASLINRVRQGAEIVIESDSQPVAVLRPPDFPRRSISETIERLKAHSNERGHKAVMDPDFAADMTEIIRNRKPADRSAWGE